MTAKRFDADKGRMEFDGEVVYRVAGNPLIPVELWDDDRLDFVEGLEPIADDLSPVPDDLQEMLVKHGYWPDQS